MPYTNRFIAADNLVVHLTSIAGTITDPGIQANYAGFLSVSAVTVYELAIKDIFNEFATRKHKTFGDFIARYSKNINGRIYISNIKDDYIKRFGGKYLVKFDKILMSKEQTTLALKRISIINNYGNLITCRHDYVHKGSPTLTITEVVNSYENGKEVIHCLNESMRR